MRWMRGASALTVRGGERLADERAQARVLGRVGDEH